MKISFVVPTYNEAESLGGLYEAICAQMEAITNDFEIVLVDDGSDDDSWNLIQEMSNNFGPSVKGIRLRRNFGKAIALEVGFRDATGDILFTMDADLQDDPKEIPRFLAKLDEGFDLVSGWKKIRHDPFSKTAPSAF